MADDYEAKEFIESVREIDTKFDHLTKLLYVVIGLIIALLIRSFFP